MILDEYLKHDDPSWCDHCPDYGRRASRIGEAEPLPLEASALEGRKL